MSRIIAVLLLLLLPLQSAFGAAAVYCKTEKPEVATHFGHHEHEQGESQNSMPGESSLDVDCEICHLGCAKLYVPLDMPMPDMAARFERPSAVPTPPDTLAPRLERPPRQRPRLVRRGGCL